MSLWKYAINPFWAASADAVTRAGGGDVRDYIPGIGDARAQAEANRINQAEAALNRQFQERMSNTAYQRATTDMRAAGINPVLAYMQGGASVPSGNQATVAAASKTGLANFALQSATGFGAYRNQATALQQQSDLNASSIKLNESNAARNLMEAERTRIENVKQEKYEPLNRVGKKVTEKAASMIEKMLDTFKDTAKKVREIKPLSDEWLRNMYRKYHPKIKIINKKELKR